MGNKTYKGLIEWEDEEIGKHSTDFYSGTDEDVDSLWDTLREYAADATIVSIEIKRVRSD